MSDDGSTAIVVIALLGNPFSPRYARARGRGPGDALSFCAMNVALYRRERTAFALQEGVVAAGQRGGTGLTIGRSSMRWEGGRLVVDLDERETPLMGAARPIRGRVVVHPEALPGVELTIDERGEHRWWPIAPLARIEVELAEPGVRFSGHGYHDANAGDIPLEATFETWSWSRARAPDGALLTYDVDCSSGAARSLAMRVTPQGDVEPLTNTWSTSLGRTGWHLERKARVDEGQSARVVRSLEDGPFYARALVQTRLGGHDAVAMHETLAAHRLRSSVVRFFTGFRMRSLVASAQGGL